MKKTIYLCLVIILLTGNCTREKKLPIEGAWQLVVTQSVANGKIEISQRGAVRGAWRALYPNNS